MRNVSGHVISCVHADVMNTGFFFGYKHWPMMEGYKAKSVFLIFFGCSQSALFCLALHLHFM